jgi:hypothetical protein
MRSFLGVIFAALAVGGSSTASTACSPCRVGGQDPVVFTDGMTNQSLTVYQTGGVGDEMLHFPQGRTYQLVHGLGTTPVSVDIFLSFRSELSESADDREDRVEPNNVSPSAGNQAVIEIWNDEIIQVRNDTCAEFYLRAVVIADPDLASMASIDGGAGAPSN